MFKTRTAVAFIVRIVINLERVVFSNSNGSKLFALVKMIQNNFQTKQQPPMPANQWIVSNYEECGSKSYVIRVPGIISIVMIKIYFSDYIIIKYCFFMVCLYDCDIVTIN